MSKRTSRKLHSQLEGLFASVPEADPAPDSNGGHGAAGRAGSVPGGWLWECDLQGRYTWCSPEVERFLGRRAADLIGREVAATALTDESAAMVRPMIESRRAVDGLRLEATAADGSELQLLFSASLRPGLTGKPDGYRGAVQVLSIRPGAAASAPDQARIEAELPAPEATGPDATLAPPDEPALARDARVDAPSWEAEPAEPAHEPSVEADAAVPAESPAPATRAETAPASEAAPAPRTPTGSLRRRPTGALKKTGALRQTGSLRKTGPLASQLAVAAPVDAADITPTEPPPLLAAWGPTSAYLDTAGGMQPITPEPGQLVTEPRVEGHRLLVPIRVKDVVLGVLAFDENEAGRPWSEDDVAMAVAISEQLAVTLQDARSAQLTEQALEEMREADRLKTQFLANMSHELRTPLNSIIGFSRVILKGIDGPVNETQEQDLKAIHHAGLHLLGLINDILDLSKIEAGKMELTFGDADLAEIVRGVMSTAAGLVKDKPIELVAHVPDRLPILQADSIRLRQILLNLVSNAAKFTDRGQIEVAVELIEDQQPAEVLVSVADTGPGIAPEDQGKLFEPFSQVDASPTRKTGGTGLGLSICRHLVELHGGAIWVESRPGEGSAFFFTLPLRPPDLAPGTAADADRLMVLALDDEAAVGDRYRAAFETDGHRVEVHAALDDVHESLRRRTPDVVVIDPQLPGQRTWNALVDLRRHEPLRRVPILLGGLNLEKGVGVRVHIADVRLRPIEAHELLGAVRRLAGTANRALRLLVIEDDEGEADAIRKAVEGDPLVTMRLAASSTEAYHATRSETPDVVILDLMMARAEGFRALEILRKDGTLRATPVLALIAPEPHPEQRRQMALYTEYLHRQGTSTPDEYLQDLKALAQAHAARR